MEMQTITNLTIPEGEVRTIHDSDNKLLWGKLSYDVKYMGDTNQIVDPVPSPDAPQLISIVTSDQEITLTGGSVSDTYTIALGAIELCKIGNYQDYIYKSGDDWYIHKEIGKYVFDGTENWNTGPYGVNSWILNNIITTAYVETNLQAISTKFMGIPASERNRAASNVCYMATNTQFWLRNTSLTSLNDVHTATTGMDAYYALSSPENIVITGTELIESLEEVNQWLIRYGYQANVVGSLPLIINQTTLN